VAPALDGPPSYDLPSDDHHPTSTDSVQEETLVASTVSGLVIDCSDPRTLAQFWADVLGYKVDEADDSSASISPASGTGLEIAFQKVPEPKTAKNRVHLDLSPADSDAEQELRRLSSLGGKQIDVGQGTDASWVVLTDPEGNEFCLL
jgi:predicted enzyme related to lactoylglutathione lyase